MAGCFHLYSGSVPAKTIDSPAVRFTTATPKTNAEKMRTYTLAFVVLATILFCTEYVSAFEVCPQENCMIPDQCENMVKGQTMCSQQGTYCCSIVKKEFRTHCRHFGGECMDQCNSELKHDAVDCENNQVCCTLV